MEETNNNNGSQGNKIKRDEGVEKYVNRKYFERFVDLIKEFHNEAMETHYDKGAIPIMPICATLDYVAQIPKIWENKIDIDGYLKFIDELENDVIALRFEKMREKFEKNTPEH